MSLVTQIQNLAVRIGTECKDLRNKQGNLASLATTDKDSLVDAINELHSALSSFSEINDSLTVAANKTYSINKILQLISDAKSEILGGASAAFDTLQELSVLIQNDQSGITALTTALGYRLRFDAAQTLSSTEQQQAQDNLQVYSRTQIGDPTTDLVATFEGALV
jgi:hypothetical protein